MDLAQTELDVYMNNQNTESKKLDETRKKLEENTQLMAEREK